MFVHKTQPELFQVLASKRKTQTSFLDNLESLFAFILLLTESLKASVPFGDRCNRGIGRGLIYEGSTSFHEESMEPLVKVLNELINCTAFDSPSIKDLG